MTDEDIRRGMPFLDSPAQEAQWREQQGYSTNVPTLSPPPDFLQGDEWFAADISKDFLDFSEPWQPPKYTLSFRGIPFAPLGGIHALTGQSGHGKTMLFSQMIAAILGGKFGELKFELNEPPKVLYIDTEQEKCNTIAVKNRVCDLIGWDAQSVHPNFAILMLRETATAIDRWRKTLRAIYDIHPTVVFIDGLLDVVEDFNSNEECQKIIYKCMQTATFYNCSLWCLVHQNPNTTKLVGHLGSILERKVTDIFTSTKDISKTGSITFTVAQKKARGRDVPSWTFEVLPIGAYGRPQQIISEDSDIPIEDIHQWLQDGRNDVQWPAYALDIKEIFKNYGNIRNNNTLQDCIERAKNRRFLEEQPKEEWMKKQKYPKFYLNI